MESGIRYFLGFFTGMAVETTFLGFLLAKYCGPLYFLNLISTFFLYLKFTQKSNIKRLNYVKNKKGLEKDQEFFQNESIVNYETIKSFSNENKELSRYKIIMNKLKSEALKV